MTISLKDYRRRRQELMALMDDDSIAVLPAATVARRNSDVTYPFRQDSDFLYLTGFEEPEAVFVLAPGREHGEAILFCREADQEADLLHGEVTGPDRARQLYGVDDAFPVADIDDILPGLIEGRSRLYYAMGAHPEFDRQVIGWVNMISSSDMSQPPGEFVQLGQYLQELRLFKSASEVKVLRRASEISVMAHRHVMRTLKPGMYEYEVQAELEYCFARNGARFPAYPSIVGGGSNACTLHYTRNSDQLKSGDLVLIDAGCEYEHYASDVTRTLPVNGKFSREQAAIYEVVLAAHGAAISQTIDGNHWNQPHEAAVSVLTEGLLDLGLLKGDVAECLELQSYKRYFMHKTGHWLGLDVHDSGDYQVDGEWRVLEPGMVTTIEPGLYIPAHSNDDSIPVAYRGIGVRIEDDVLVTRKGNEILTDDLPRRRRDIEKEMSDAG